MLNEVGVLKVPTGKPLVSKQSLVQKYDFGTLVSRDRWPSDCACDHPLV